jgi:hypothetical protein
MPIAKPPKRTLAGRNRFGEAQAKVPSQLRNRNPWFPDPPVVSRAGATILPANPDQRRYEERSGEATADLRHLLMAPATRSGASFIGK